MKPMCISQAYQKLVEVVDSAPDVFHHDWRFISRETHFERQIAVTEGWFLTLKHGQMLNSETKLTDLISHKLGLTLLTRPLDISRINFGGTLHGS